MYTLTSYIHRLKWPGVILAVFILGIVIGGFGKNTHDHTDLQIAENTLQQDIQVWTCSMHPQIRQPSPGQCPICGMDLIPVATESADTGAAAGELTLSPRASKLAGLQLAVVERRFVTKDIRMVGKVAYDERKIGTITSWIPGRIDRLYVDYTGIPVRKGDHLVEIYSPELFTAQEELAQALKTAAELDKSTGSTMKELSLQTVAAAREKLRLLGMTPEQIQEFEQRGKPTEHVTIYSPTGGIVIHKNAVEGLYVGTGTKIYTIADLSEVWVQLDVYESDLEWIRYGQNVEFVTEAYPGEVFKGKIAFIDPLLNDRTRTVKVRVNVPNSEGKLKPDMFVRATVHSQVASGGKVMDTALAGKYICPMHPEVVKNSPGTCDICGMPLEKAESLGYSSPQKTEAPLVIPASAPLITGKRAVVYTSIPGKEGTYAGREIVLGPRTGDYYQVEHGLSEGEMVVTNGNFKIDSAVQILAGPSMMNPMDTVMPAMQHSHGGGQIQLAQAGGQSGTRTEAMDNNMLDDSHAKHGESGEMDSKIKQYDAPQAFKAQLDSVYTAYFRVQYALSHDSLEDAKKQNSQLDAALKKVDMKLLSGEAHMAWMNELGKINTGSSAISSASALEDARKSFESLSESLISVAKMYGTTGNINIYRFHCPMAFDNKGADWLQGKQDLENPWFGSMMLKCGSLEETISETKK